GSGSASTSAAPSSSSTAGPSASTARPARGRRSGWTSGPPEAIGLTLADLPVARYPHRLRRRLTVAPRSENHPHHSPRTAHVLQDPCHPHPGGGVVGSVVGRGRAP